MTTRDKSLGGFILKQRLLDISDAKATQVSLVATKDRATRISMAKLQLAHGHLTDKARASWEAFLASELG